VADRQCLLGIGVVFYSTLITHSGTQTPSSALSICDGRILPYPRASPLVHAIAAATEQEAMQQVLNEVAQIAQRLAAIVWQALEFIWNWSFGQIVRMFQMPFNDLPLWKQVLFVLVIGAMAYFLFTVATDLLRAVQSVLRAIVGLIGALVAMLPQIVWAGLIAFGGAWVITNLNPTWIPVALQ